MAAWRKRIESMILPTICLAAVCWFAACKHIPTPDEETIEYQALQQGTWHTGERLDFQLFIPRGGSTYRVSVLLRTDNRCNSENITLSVRLRCGTQYNRADTLHIPLAEAPGIWHGRGVAVMEHQITLYHSIAPPQAGLYTLTVSPIRNNTTQGVQSVGVHMQKVTQE